MPSSRSYSIVEPHPSVSSNSYIPTGRGGAGNVTRAPTTVTRGSDARGPPSRLPGSSISSSSTSSSSRAFLTGRGGAGNIQHPPSERAIFSFDEELERQISQDRHAAPVYHVGRGGAGNRHAMYSQPTSVYPGGVNVRKRSDQSDDSGRSTSGRSTSSAESGADVATRKLRDGWRKITGIDLRS